jgi:SAM-dependent methyltransferase
MSRRISFDLFLISAVVLFLELACIRWFPAHVIYLSFFTNIILLACFVGMSVGCLTASHSTNYLERTPFWLLVTFGFGFLLELFRKGLERKISVGGSTAAEVIFFGAELGAKKELSFAIPIELFAGMFFLLIATCFLGPGQVMGRAFNQMMTQRNRAYAWNLLGSGAGIVLFALISWFSLPPVLWFTFLALGLGYFLLQVERPQWGAFACIILTMLLLTDPHSWFAPFRSTQWSPYYRIDFENGDVRTNLGWHQHIWDFDKRDPAPPIAYDLPLIIQRDSGRADLRILMIGSGSGNDLSRVLRYSPGEAKVDAVEIDPVIQRIGKFAHPAKPYSDPRVTLHLNDGRNHLRQMAELHPGEYDLILFGVVDSLVLHSGYSSLRLESFLFTKEAIDDVRKCLKPTGRFMVYNYFRQGWLVTRLRDTLRTVFDHSPIVLTIPGREQLTSSEAFDGFTLFIAGQKESLDGLSAKLPKILMPFNLAGENRIQETQIPDDSESTLATDDWPFFYQRERTIPSLTWRGMAIMLFGTAFLLWFTLGKRNSSGVKWRFDPRMFFLGAGFMLIETRAVVQMALLFGSTWVVNVFVFLGVLLLSFCGNLLAMRFKPKNLMLGYVGLFATLVLQRLLTLDNLLGLEPSIRALAAIALVLAPMFFAGIIFAASFGRSAAPDQAFGMNILGAVVGGVLENFTMLLGFRNLLFVAILIYLLSIWTRKPTQQDDTAL